MRLKFKVKFSGCAMGTRASRRFAGALQELCMDLPRAGAAKFRMVLKRKKYSVSGKIICLCLEATVGTLSHHLIH